MIGQYIDIYKITEKLGQGGMGSVWKATDTQLDRTVALKAMNVQDAMFLQRFQAEAKALARLDHPAIVRVYNLLPSTPIGTVMVMEYVKGKSWSDLILEGKYNTPEDAIRICSQLLDALQYAHDKKIIHRDIKPSNIMITEKGQVKVTDFGLAKLIDPRATMAQSPLTQVGQAVGSLFYMSPEQVKGLDTVDHRTDLYSSGITLYEALTGRPPFDEKTATSPYVIQKMIVDGNIPPIAQQVQDMPLDLAKVIARSISVKPEKRYQSASEMRDALQQISSSSHQALSQPFKQSSPSVRPIRTTPTVPKNWMMYAGIAAVLLVGSVGGWYLMNDKPEPTPIIQDMKPPKGAPETPSNDVSLGNSNLNNQNGVVDNGGTTVSPPPQSPPQSLQPQPSSPQVIQSPPQQVIVKQPQVVYVPSKPQVVTQPAPSNPTPVPSNPTPTRPAPTPAPTNPTPAPEVVREGKLNVVVQDENGNPIAGTISINGVVAAGHSPRVVNYATKSGTATVNVQAEGYRGKSISVSVPAGGTGRGVVILSKIE